jgi:hypothetical protein
MKVIKPLVSIVATMEVNFVTMYSSGVIVATSWLRPKSFWL